MGTLRPPGPSYTFGRLEGTSPIQAGHRQQPGDPVFRGLGCPGIDGLGLTSQEASRS